MKPRWLPAAFNSVLKHPLLLAFVFALVGASCKPPVSVTVQPHLAVASPLKLPAFAVQEISPDVIKVTGSWSSKDFPESAFTMRFDRVTMRAVEADATVVHLRLSEAELIPEVLTYEIEQWNDQEIKTKVTQCGRSQRYVQYTLDRKQKTFTRSFTGKGPETRTLSASGVK